MSMILVFTRKWNACYRVLRHHNKFSFVESLRYGLWLARGRVETTMNNKPNATTVAAPACARKVPWLGGDAIITTRDRVLGLFRSWNPGPSPFSLLAY